MNNTFIKRIDSIFSYWLFFWFLLYICKFTTYNPYFSLIVGLIINILMFIIYLYYKNYYKAFLFVIVNIIIKVIPIYILRKSKIMKKDIYAFFILYIIYLFYCYILHINVYNFDINSFNKKNINTPFMFYLDKIIQFFYKT